jgi:hypothetical protein
MNFLRKSVLFLLPHYFKIGKYVLDTTHQPQDAMELRIMFEHIKHWCVLNEFLVPTKSENVYYPNIVGSASRIRLQLFVYEINFKRLCMRSYLKEALILFKDTEYDCTTSRLYDLYLRLLTETNPRILNLYINNLHHGLTSLYVDDFENDDILSWEEIFTTYPYLWLLFPIQQIMRDATPISAPN